MEYRIEFSACVKPCVLPFQQQFPYDYLEVRILGGWYGKEEVRWRRRHALLRAMQTHELNRE